MRPVVAGLLLVGCTADSNYDLRIDPFVPANLDMTLGDPDVTLVLRADRTTLYPLGPVSEDSFGDLPPLDDGTVGLLFSASGTASDTYDPEHLVAYGESPLGGALGDDRESRSVGVVVSAFAGVGEVGTVPRRRAPLLGAAALDPLGGVTLFGGEFEGDPHDRIQRIGDLRAGVWEAVEAGAMPQVQGSGARVMLTATPLTDGTVLVSGGRPIYFSISDNLRSAFVWDPATESVIWEDAEAMSVGRSQHVAVRVRNGRVLVAGGWLGAGVDGELATYQMFDPVERRFVAFGTSTAGALGLAATEVGGEGAVLCGGFSFSFDDQVLTPKADCDRVTLSGDVLPFPDLPVPVGMGAMASLPDGRILHAGGVFAAIPIPFEDGFLVGANTGTASDRAFLYEPSTQAWREVDGLQTARAAAVAVPSGDGRIVVIGGAEQAGPMISEDEGPVYCPELWDPESESFRIPGPCSTPGSGAFPQVSVQPGLGAFVVEGHLGAGSEAGGQGYGLVGLAPPL